MKKLLILLAVIVVIAGLWWWGSTRVSVLETEGKLARAEPGLIEVPISASGEARERQRVEIKAEASGTIIKIAVDEGDIVQADQLLLQIDEEEELRNKEKAQAAVDQATESVEIAKLSHEQAVEDEEFNVDMAQEAFNLASARFDYAKFEYERFKDLAGDDHSSVTELMRKQTEYLTTKADLGRARVDLARAKRVGPRNVRRTAREIKQAEARLRSTEYTLSDTERRLRKTKVRNNYPSACRVVRIFVSEGQVLSSAISVVGAGTPVMELADISQMEVVAQVDESDVDKVVRMMAEGREQRQSAQPTSAPADDDEPGYRDEVQVRFDALPQEVFGGQIVDVAQKPRMLAQIITYDVRIRLYDDPRIESVRLGMQSTVEFSPACEEGLCIPYEAVHKLGRDSYTVKMPDPDDPRGEEIDREVEVGLTDGSKVIVRAGLEPHEEFYVKLPQRIRKGED